MVHAPSPFGFGPISVPITMRSYPTVPLSLSPAAKNGGGDRNESKQKVLKKFSMVENVPTPRESDFELFRTFQLQCGETQKKMLELY